MKVPLLFSALFTITYAATTSKNNANNDNDNNNQFVDPTWYTAYTKYPEYCSTPSQMAERTIPPLKKDSRMGETRLVHVTASIRHGARTPVGTGFQCWDTYWDDTATGVWDCDLKTEMAPPTPLHFWEQQNKTASAGLSDSIMLFEKHYDALQDKPDHLVNGLFGTCQSGQLLTRGYAQHASNGQILRDAYCYDSDLYNHDIQMRLIDLKDNQPWESVYLRSDDDQRVLLSGQVLLRTMLEPEIDRAIQKGQPVRIPVHLADKENDVVGVNTEVCPRLKELRDKIEQTSIFRSFNNSKEANELRKFMKNELKAGDIEIDILGCLLPNVCTDRPLPDAFDYEHSDVFERMIRFAYKKFNIHLLANDAEFSKLAMAPIWAEIMDQINPILNGKPKGGVKVNRFHLVSGHDDTVAPLMASLGVWNDTNWAPYASMFLIEIHETVDGQQDKKVLSSKFAFRLIYNGNVITQHVKGCLDDAELCDMKVFLDIVSDFATRDRNCGVSTASRFFSLPHNRLPNPLKSFLLILLGAILGGAAVTYYLTGAFCCRRKTISHQFIPEGNLSMPTGNYSDEPQSINTYQD